MIGNNELAQRRFLYPLLPYKMTFLANGKSCYSLKVWVQFHYVAKDTPVELSFYLDTTIVPEVPDLIMRTPFPVKFNSFDILFSENRQTLENNHQLYLFIVGKHFTTEPFFSYLEGNNPRDLNQVNEEGIWTWLCVLMK